MANSHYNVCFRVDASVNIGIGHFMRCLTLANSISHMGGKCRFVCRFLTDNLYSLLSKNNHEVVVLQSKDTKAITSCLFHKDWLGVNVLFDANETLSVASDIVWDWFVVDHYGIDERWEERISQISHNILVIDDLADRKHRCDILLDQTLGRREEEYQHLVPESATILTGAKYAILRPEFSHWRDYSLSRRKDSKLQEILISMGGTDLYNATETLLSILNKITFPNEVRITIVLGASSKNIERIKALSIKSSLVVKLIIDCDNMAELMSESDFIIGSAGTTSWERCCLGVPSCMVVMADNQQLIASHLSDVGASIFLGDIRKLKDTTEFYNKLSNLINDSDPLKNIGIQAAKVTQGEGVLLVTNMLMGYSSDENLNSM